jgi:hypothetical protein
LLPFFIIIVGLWMMQLGSSIVYHSIKNDWIIYDFVYLLLHVVEGGRLPMSRIWIFSLIDCFLLIITLRRNKSGNEQSK